MATRTRRKSPTRGDSLPSWVEPQLARLVEEPPPGDRWAHELKHDGYRIHVRLDRGDVRLLTRSGLNWAERYAEIAEAATRIKAKTAYIDGELCALRKDGTSSFADLQAATDARSAAGLTYIAFDLLYLNGEDLMPLPLLERKKRLAVLLKAPPAGILYGEHIVGAGEKFFEAACTHHAEGIVSKRIDAPYAPGNRGIWQKVKCYHREEFVIVGYSDPEGARPSLGALLLAYYADDGRLIYAGRAGTGMSDRELKRLHDRLKPITLKKIPLDQPPPRKSRFGSPLVLSRVHWVRPELVAEVRYMTWTADGLPPRDL